MSFNHFTPYSISALKGVNVEVLSGDFCILAGPNGSGKSTLLKLISGRISTPDSGGLTLDGSQLVSVPEHERARWISYVAQHPVDGTAPSLTVAENLKLAEMRGDGNVRFSLGLNRKKKEDYRQLLSSIGLDNRLDQPVSTLSGGERQMLTILMSSFGPPALMLLDEPVSALDPSYSEKCLKLISSLNKDRGITILMVTHNVSQILTLGNTLVMMKNGLVENIYSMDEKSKLKADDLITKIYD
jgi:putative ABC transport system ATP-binding protein